MNNKNGDQSQVQYMPIGMCIGVALGVAVGAFTHNMALCMCVGLSVGMATGAFIDAKIRKTNEAKTESSEEAKEEE